MPDLRSWSIAVVVGAAFWWLLPPARRSLTLAADARTVRGALHVHTRRSDGTGTPEDVAKAAARAGLDFVVLTDHGDAHAIHGRAAVHRRRAGPRRRRDQHQRPGTTSRWACRVRHIGLPVKARDVVEDVHRLGGFGIVAHPDSPKAELSWRRLAGGLRRAGMAERRQPMARRAARRAGADGPVGTGCAGPSRSCRSSIARRRRLDAMGRADRAPIGRRRRGPRCARADVDGRRVGAHRRRAIARAALVRVRIRGLRRSRHARAAVGTHQSKRRTGRRRRCWMRCGRVAPIP